MPRWLLPLVLTATTVLGAGGALARPAGAQTETGLPATAALAPERAVLYVAVDLDFASSQWRQAEALLTRAGFPDAVADLQERIVDGEDGATPVAESDADALLGGEVGFVFTDFELPAGGLLPAAAGGTGLASPVASAETAGFGGLATVLLADDPDAAWETTRARLEADAAEQGGDVEGTTYRDIEIRALTPVAPAAEGQAIARIDDYVLFAADPADLEPIIDTAAGETPALSDFEPLADVRGRLNPEVLLFGFANNSRLIEAFGPEALAQLRVLSPQFEQSLEASSPEERDAFEAAVAGSPVPEEFASYIGLALWADDPGLRADVVITIPEGRETGEELLTNADLALDERVPEDALFFANGDIGPTSLFTSVATSLVPMGAVFQDLAGGLAEGTPIADLATPDADDPAAFIEAQFDEVDRALGFDLRAELTDELVGEYGFSIAASPQSVFTGDLSGVVLSEVDDEATVAESLRKVARLIEQGDGTADVSTRLVAGDTVYVVRDPESPITPIVEFGVVGGEWLLGIGSGIDDYVAGLEAPLADDERYKRVLATLPEEYAQVVYVNVGGIVGLVDGLSGLAAGPIGSGAAATPAASPEPGPAERFGAIEAFAQVTYVDDDVSGISAILYVAE